MARPRVHDLEQLMDVAERMAVDSGPTAVTVRALSEAAAVSNGAIYHAFGSRAGLLGRVWVRAGQRYLDLQHEVVEQARTIGSAEEAAVDAVVAAADAPAEFLLRYPISGRFVLTVRRSELLGAQELPAAVVTELRALDQLLITRFGQLAHGVWGREDQAAVTVIRDCVVELPTALLLRGARHPGPLVRKRLATAVRAVLSVPLPTPHEITPETTREAYR